MSLDSAPDPTTQCDGVRQYLAEVGRVPLLSEVEELRLAIAIAEGQAAAHDLADLAEPQGERAAGLRRSIIAGDEASPDRALVAALAASQYCYSDRRAKPVTKRGRKARQL